MNPEFFFDTANLDELNEIKNWLGEDHSRFSIGITTNPNAISKVGIHTLTDLKKHVAKLIKWGNETCTSGFPGFSVYIQYPDSNVTDERLQWFINEMSSVDVDHLGYKIPPRPSLIDAALMMHNNINVTGLADAGTVISCLNHSYGGDYGEINKIRFASIIPGRMEEAGVDANSHLDFIRGTNDVNEIGQNRLITGSCRTIDGLKRSIGYQSVPTIGYKVWKLIMDNHSPDEFIKWFDEIIPFGDQWFCPTTSDINHNLSKSFFQQMDLAGEKLKNDLERCFY